MENNPDDKTGNKNRGIKLKNASTKTRNNKIKKRRSAFFSGPVKTTVTQTRLIRAILGTGGVKSAICERLQITRAHLNNLLKRDDWQDVQAVYDAERERVGDIAESTIIDVMSQRMDTAQALKAAQYWLDRQNKDRGFGDKKTTVLEGGENPIGIKSAHLDLSSLPVEMRRQILASIEAQNNSEEEREDEEENEE